MDFSKIPTPAEAMRPTPEQLEEIEALTRLVAEALVGLDPAQPVYVSTRTYSQRAVQAVKEGLRKQGWSAEFREHQIDGGWLTITPAASATDYYAK